MNSLDKPEHWKPDPTWQLAKDLVERDKTVAKLEAEVAQLKSLLELRARTMTDMGANLVAALDRAEAAEAKLEAKG